jgi:hypothetical protein
MKAATISKVDKLNSVLSAIEKEASYIQGRPIMTGSDLALSTILALVRLAKEAADEVPKQNDRLYSDRLCGDRPPVSGDDICQECCNEVDPQ